MSGHVEMLQPLAISWRRFASFFSQNSLQDIRTIRNEAVRARLDDFPHEIWIIGCPRDDSDPNRVQLRDRDENGVLLCFLHANHREVDR